MTTNPFTVSQPSIDTNPYWGNSFDINIDNFSIGAHGKLLFKDTSLHIAHKGKYGLVGHNGSGKSTLFKMIANGELQIPPRIDFLYLEQEVDASDMRVVDMVIKSHTEYWELTKEALDSNTDGHRLGEVYEQLADLSNMESHARRILFGLGFDSQMQEQPTKIFSGGWRMRISLARALFIEPTLLMLDEPTNHLDLNACVWLTNYLQKWKKTLLIISHDIELLNSVCEKTLVINDKKIIQYNGNYDTFKQIERHEFTQAVKDWKKNQQKMIQLQKSGKGKGKLNSLKQPREYRVQFKFADVLKLPRAAIELQDVSWNYNNQPYLFHNINMCIETNSRICIVGPNGVGKSTLLKIMNGEINPNQGEVKYHNGLRKGVYNQHFADQLPMDLTPIEYLCHKFVDINYQDARAILGKVNLPGQAHALQIKMLSGGQKARVMLAELILLQPHILILDEPTNNLDIESIEALCKALNNYTGGVVVVSHDARLIESIDADLWLIENQNCVLYPGTFNDYKRSIIASIDGA